MLGRWAEVEEEAFFQLFYIEEGRPGRPGSAGRSLAVAAQLRTTWSAGSVAVNSQQAARSASTAHAELWTRQDRTASRFIRACLARLTPAPSITIALLHNIRRR